MFLVLFSMKDCLPVGHVPIVTLKINIFKMWFSSMYVCTKDYRKKYDVQSNK